MFLKRTRARWTRTREERGSATLEMALVTPMLFAVLFGIIDFGGLYNAQLTQRQGTRDAARTGAVGNLGTSTTCNLTGVNSNSWADVSKLLCQAKSMSSSNSADVRVKVILNPLITRDASGVACASSPSTQCPAYSKGNGLIVCTQMRTHSASKFYSRLIEGKFASTKVEMPIETLAANTPTNATQTDFFETAFTNWNWCTNTSATA